MRGAGPASRQPYAAPEAGRPMARHGSDTILRQIRHTNDAFVLSKRDRCA